MQKKTESLFIQDKTDTSQTPETSHQIKFLGRKFIFKALFKGIEAIWMIVQIIQYLCEIFK